MYKSCDYPYHYLYFRPMTCPSCGKSAKSVLVKNTYWDEVKKVILPSKGSKSTKEHRQ